MPIKTLAVTLVCLFAAVPLAVASDDASGSEASKPAISEAKLQSLDKLLEIPRGMSRAEAIRTYVAQTRKVLELGNQIEEDHPNASNLYKVWQRMYQAASFLARQAGDEAARQRLLGIAAKIVNSDAPIGAKPEPDFLLTLSALSPKEDESPDKEKAVKSIDDYFGRYKDTPAAAQGAVFATVLALRTDQKAAANKYIEKLETDYIKSPDALGLLRELGRHPDVGRPFEAELIRLDGTKLSLPEDLKGKVVVVDFWATWCKPCRASMPHLKEAYAAYRDKGVEFVGVSLDRPGQKERVKQYVSENELNWIHTYSGKFWSDPTARRYGVSGIPAMWVIGKSGNVVSDNARGKLEAVIEQALQEQVDKEPKGGKG